jgi:hypothetical protein
MPALTKRHNKVEASTPILAQLLNMTYENRPDDLVKPDLTHFFKKELDEFEIWQKKIQFRK